MKLFYHFCVSFLLIPQGRRIPSKSSIGGQELELDSGHVVQLGAHHPHAGGSFA